MPFRSLCFLALLITTALAGAQNIPRSSHVWIINEENTSYEQIVGNPQMPYYNQLISRYGLATQFYADQHSSLPALMWFVAGAPVDLNNDTVSCRHNNDNVVRELLKRGYTWRSYQEDMPMAGFQELYGGEDGNYYRRHNPLIDFSDACPGGGQAMNSVPFTQMATDFAQGDTPNFAWITPGATEDAHSGTLQQADRWLRTHVPAILSRPEFQPGGDGILFIVWDEGGLYNDNRCSATVSQGCGGRTATLVIGPRVIPGYQSTRTYHSENVLATVCAAMGLPTCPGAARKAAPMSDFFTSGNAAAAPTNSITVSTPGDGATVVGAVHLIASASENQPVNQMQVWDNGVKLGWYPGTEVNQVYHLAPGTHTTTVEDLDPRYKLIRRIRVTYSVEALEHGVQIITPDADQTLHMSTVHIVAQANESVPVSQLQVWDNGVRLGWYHGASVNQYFNLAPGAHTVTVVDLDDHYRVIHQSTVAYSVQ